MEPGPQTFARAFELAQKAVALDDSSSTAHRTLGMVYLFLKQHEQAIAEAERAVALDPNFADAYVTLATILIYARRPEEAIGLVEKAMRLNPHYLVTYLNFLGLAYLGMGRDEEAIAPLKKAVSRNLNWPPLHWNLAWAYSELGRNEEARTEAAEILRLNPNFSLEMLRQHIPVKDPAQIRG